MTIPNLLQQFIAHHIAIISATGLPVETLAHRSDDGFVALFDEEELPGIAPPDAMAVVVSSDAMTFRNPDLALTWPAWSAVKWRRTTAALLQPRKKGSDPLLAFSLFFDIDNGAK